MEQCFYCMENATGICESCNIVRYCSQNHLAIHRTKTGYCQPFKVQFKEDIGNHFQTVRDIKPFELILEDTASAWGTYDDSKPLCLSCLRLADLNAKCRLCNLPMCGSTECMDSPIHAPECRILRMHRPEKLEITGNHPVYALIAPLRIFQLKQSALQGDEDARSVFEQVMKLESHLEVRKKGKVQRKNYMTNSR